MIAVASRAALRMIPNLALAQRGASSFEPRHTIIIASFRAVSMAWAFPLAPDNANLFRGRGIHKIYVDDGPCEGEPAAFAAARACELAAEVVSAPLSKGNLGRIADIADRTLIEARASAYGVGPHVRPAVAGNKSEEEARDAAEFDMLQLHEGMAPAALSVAALWPTVQPKWSAFLWKALKENLAVPNENWRVWTEWYEARLRGEPIALATELARVVDISEAEWRLGPAIVNAKLLALLHNSTDIKSTRPETSPRIVPSSTYPSRRSTLLNVQLQVRQLEKQALNDLADLDSRLPNDPETEVQYRKQREVLMIFANGLEKIAIALEDLPDDASEGELSASEDAIQALGARLSDWWEANAVEAIDCAIRLPVFALTVALLNFAGANMTIGTAMAAAIVGRKDVTNVIQLVRGKADK